MGTVKAIWLKRAHRGPMDAVAEACLLEGRGLEGSVGRSKRRQVSIIDEDIWTEMMSALGASVDPSSRRANLMLSGIVLPRTRGRVLGIGDTRIVIGGELAPCERMDEALPGLQEAMRPDWRGGVFGQVLVGGTIRVGDRVEWIALPAPE